MKIAVSATHRSLEADVDPRFGRCMCFVIVETEDNEIKGHKEISNEAIQATRGAGVQAAQIVANEGAEVVITGNIGPNAFNVLSQTGIKIVTGVSGKVSEVVKKYLKGELKETIQPTVSFGPGRGRGSGRGRWDR
jgi:predicted Fe-Mo cluster-binding NifX family protein